VRAVREGSDPRFLHLHTYRLTGHTGADSAAYRPKEEVERRWQDDPIARAAALLESAGVSGEALTAARNDAFAEMRLAYDAAKATPYPPVEHAFADVQDVGDPRREAF
jgi:pyruvate dehydrogenase E1 component alpha subunit